MMSKETILLVDFPAMLEIPGPILFSLKAATVYAVRQGVQRGAKASRSPVSTEPCQRRDSARYYIVAARGVAVERRLIRR
jgi:hypothetical protein